MPRRRLLLPGLLLAFIYMAWAVPFMLESSVLAIDGGNDPLPSSPKCTWEYMVDNRAERAFGGGARRAVGVSRSQTVDVQHDGAGSEPWMGPSTDAA